jgi:CheY-like chemotaxis protein
MLLKLGYKVLTADDGCEAIIQITKHNETIDAILMDQSMPNMDGITSTRNIRALEAAGKLSKRTPIIAVTAVVSSESQHAFQDAGADDFLSKPLALGKLKDTLVLYLGHG